MKKSIVIALVVLASLCFATSAFAENGSILPWGTRQTKQIHTQESGTKLPW